jgi:trk system potassium uptake protein TrkA
MRRHFVIVGLDRLGSAMIATLVSLDQEVLGIDTDERIVQDLSERFPEAHFVAADATDQSILRDLNVGHFDAAAVVIGENMEASILATANLKEIGVPYVVARAGSREAWRRPGHRAREGDGGAGRPDDGLTHRHGLCGARWG